MFTPPLDDDLLLASAHGEITAASRTREVAAPTQPSPSRVALRPLGSSKPDARLRAAHVHLARLPRRHGSAHLVADSTSTWVMATPSVYGRWSGSGQGGPGPPAPRSSRPGAARRYQRHRARPTSSGGPAPHRTRSGAARVARPPPRLLGEVLEKGRRRQGVRSPRGHRRGGRRRTVPPVLEDNGNPVVQRHAHPVVEAGQWPIGDGIHTTSPAPRPRSSSATRTLKLVVCSVS